MLEITKQFIIYFYPYIIFFIFIDLLYIFGYKKIVGKAGEHHVKKQIKDLDNTKYLIINDLMISVKNITHQIDHVVVSPYGIFVIETKQYNGYIKGNEYDKKWIQNKKIYINNPIHQNYGHVKALEELLNLSIDKFIPIVCIPSRATVKVKSKTPVLRYHNLNSTILSYDKVILDNYKEIYNNLLKLNIVDKNLRKKHVNYAKNIKKEKELNSQNKCPKCGGDLVKRTGKYGDFIGCSNYPKCKYNTK